MVSTTGQNYRMNQRKSAIAQRKFEFFKNMKITQRLSHVHTLRKSSRKKIHQTLSRSQYIWPWVKDPDYKLSLSQRLHAYGPASLLGLPAELRQSIFALTLDNPTQYRREEIGAWIGVLSSVAPLTRLDMLHVGGKWKQAQTRDSRDLPPVLHQPLWRALPLPVPPQPVRGKLVPRAKERRAAEVFALYQAAKKELRAPAQKTKPNPDKSKAKKEPHTAAQKSKPVPNKKKKKKPAAQRQIRDQKCYYCEQRHYTQDPVCRMARKDPGLWNSMTKKIQNRKQIVEKDISSAYTGRKILFFD